MLNKRIYNGAILILATLILGHILGIQVIVLVSIMISCGMIFFADSQMAAVLLFLFSPLSYIFAYNQYNLFIFVAIAYIMKCVMKRSIRVQVLSGFFLVFYCYVFADMSMRIKIGDLIYPILLALVIFVCTETEKETYIDIFRAFTTGFIVSAIVGLYKEKIPSILALFGSDLLYIDGVETSMSIQRYSGLSYDPNFFALIDCILIAIILFNYKKIDWKLRIQLVFLIIIGFFTFSKSYILLLIFIGVVYVLKHSRHTLRILIFILTLMVCLIIVEKFVDIKVISLISARFSTANGADDLTTGRLDLWRQYLTHVFTHPMVMLFGEGFNALSLEKAAHNTYVDFLYRFGLLGSVMWCTYFRTCYKMSKRKQLLNKAKVTNMPLLVCAIGFVFLSAFHFQQLWCCICLAIFSVSIQEGGELCQS